MTTLLVNSIYRATEGEGIHIGTPQIFVRFQGCNIGCVNCDTKETWDFDLAYAKSLDEVMEKVEVLSQDLIKRVSITGGDPLHPSHVPGLLELIRQLKARNYFVNIEAAGTRIVKDVFDLCDFISYDYKTPSTTVKTSKKTLLEFLRDYGTKAQVKAVVSDKKDFEATFDAFHFIRSEAAPVVPWVLTPCFEPGEEFPMNRFQQVVQLNESFGLPFRVIGQQHKWVYGPDAKSV
ncbi:MAG TPA: 7-carboxy-7-deazaguanine synthase QueE [Bacteriovoracaceae bacterium]|nr:7-carboxy-7-deazaguanine synthase QueE [Bacteriovoracaceae bacterium]